MSPQNLIFGHHHVLTTLLACETQNEFCLHRLCMQGLLEAVLHVFAHEHLLISPEVIYELQNIPWLNA